MALQQAAAMASKLAQLSCSVATPTIMMMMMTATMNCSRLWLMRAPRLHHSSRTHQLYVTTIAMLAVHLACWRLTLLFVCPTQHTQVVKRDVTNTLDSSTYRPESFQNWGDTSTREAIRNRFVTGDWGKGTLHWFGSLSVPTRSRYPCCMASFRLGLRAGQRLGQRCSRRGHCLHDEQRRRRGQR